MAQKMRVSVPTVEKSAIRLFGLPQDISLIREREKLSYGRLASALGVSKSQVWQWEHGNGAPREPLILLSLLSWSDQLRESAA